MADQQLVTTTSAVIKEMTDNANFPNPPVNLKTLATAVDDLSAAMAAQVQGGTASTALKNNKLGHTATLRPDRAGLKFLHSAGEPYGFVPSTRYPAVVPGKRLDLSQLES